MATLEEIQDTIEKNPDMFDHLKSKDRFGRWIKINVHIYNEFEKLAIKLKSVHNRDYYSAYTIVEKMRWDTMIAQTQPSEFKISNDCIPWLSRIAMCRNSALYGMFKFTKSKK